MFEKICTGAITGAFAILCGSVSYSLIKGVQDDRESNKARKAKVEAVEAELAALESPAE